AKWYRFARRTDRSAAPRPDHIDRFGPQSGSVYTKSLWLSAGRPGEPQMNSVSLIMRRQAGFFRRRLLAIILVFSGAGAAHAQTDVSGFWVLRVPTGDGNFRETFFELKQNGEAITGKVLAGSREVPITEGGFKNGVLQFVVIFGTAPQTRR